MTNLINRLEKLTPQQRAVLAERLQALQRQGHHQQLIAYLVPKATAVVPEADQLRASLQEQLPDYMIPSHFILLEALPLTPNGKLDRQALPEPEAEWDPFGDDFEAPRNDIEAILADIWQTVLGLEAVSIHDNFFDVGGDSILSIQILAKANQAGLKLAPNQIFKTPTIAELALNINSETGTPAEQALIAGKLPLTPIQHWFFGQNLVVPAQWNQAYLLKVPADADARHLAEGIQMLMEHHDALRLVFQQTDTGWQAQITPPQAESSLETVDLSGLAEAEQPAKLQQYALAIQQSLHLQNGPLLKASLFDLGAHREKQLLLVAHHLVIDGLSWQILLEDLQTAYQALTAGQDVTLPDKTTSYKAWAETLVQTAEALSANDALAYWLDQSDPKPGLLPVELPGEASQNTEGQAKTVTVCLTKEETRQLLYEVSAAYQTQTNDLLLSALGQSLWPWREADQVLVGLEAHGRELIRPDIDLSRTVGWFTAFYPLILTKPRSDSLADIIKAIKEQRRQIPDNGLGYGIARYLSQNEAIIQQLNAYQPQILFNYLGQYDQLMGNAGHFTLLSTPIAGARHADNQRSHLLDINALITRGQLRAEWTYSPHHHRAETVEQLATAFIVALREIISHCLSPDSGGFTPSDFPEADLDQAELDDLLAEFGEMAD